MHGFLSALVLCRLAIAQDVPKDSPIIPLEPAEEKSGDPTMIKHVLWSKTMPKPDEKAYADWYKTSDLDWVSDEELPQVAADAKVDIFYCTKPVFSIVGRTTGIWHGGLAFRVQDGPSYLFEFTSLDFLEAIAYPDKGGSDPSQGLHWPSLSIADYHFDASGKTFPVTGGPWKEVTAIGTTTGAGFSSYAKWAHAYAQSHARYLVWRVVDAESKRTVIDSVECFDFVFRGLRFLNTLDKTAINATELPRTVVNVYASSIDTVPFNSTVDDFFASETRTLAEWLQLSGIAPKLFARSKDWYWPAWYSVDWTGGSGLGKMLQNTDYPQTYHRYAVTFPSSKEKALKYGLHRANVPVFDTSKQTLMV